MKQCHEHHEAMTKNMDEASTALEGAKQSNDLAKMRAAIDEHDGKDAGHGRNERIRKIVA